MNKSFIFEVEWKHAYQIRNQLLANSLPCFMVSTSEGKVEFSFPDLLHRQYNQVRKIFGEDGLKRKRK
ncbi:hypothetical protein POF51_29645 [Brevibacillus sp. AG]|uniref:hypothetical protein n=1 Tax=Brevibacillus sp. AG TaxID=3020891 RepID=UPI00232E4A60|nr:hypothetical protein [Brevibacillus sp. AG]MDC0764888.1 hypothetical protein [Brevibacillus sp. AG]